MNNLIEAIFTALTEIATKFGAFLGNLFQGLADVFYLTNESGGELTIIGIFSLIALVSSFAIWGLKWLLSLLRLNR